MTRLEKFIKEDALRCSQCDYIPWDKLKNKKLLVTGATGLIGSSIVRILLHINEWRALDLSILILTRSTEKARKVFGADLDKIILIHGGGYQTLPDISSDIDYIIHGASPTSSKFFVENPVETLETAFYGTNSLLRLAVDKNVSAFLYLSSMEVYGTPEKGTRIKESDSGSFDPAKIRNCYPLGKIVCENLCCSYAKEYNVPVKIARLTQTFGPGVDYKDSRVFAEFARCAVEHRDIVLKTKGQTQRDYLYTADAVSGILTILLKGECGQAYTVANEGTYCSVYEMAGIVAETYGIGLRVQEQDVFKQGYADTLYMDLDTEKIGRLGWRPTVGLGEMYRRMIEAMGQEAGD